MKVVIVGGGFGGVKTALNLANKKGFEVKLISSQDFFEYHAALYRSATGRSPLEVAIPLKDFFAYANNIEIINAKIIDLDQDKQVVIAESGASYTYETLVMALGNVTEFYGIKGLKDYSYGVKSIHEALKLKWHLHNQLLDEQAERNYVVIGAGASGIELAAEMASYLRIIRRKHKVRRHFKIDLIEASDRVVATMPKRYSTLIQKRLKKLGVNLYLNTAVKSESVEGISLPNGDIKTHTVIWTAGITNNPFFSKFPSIFKLGKGNRVDVDEHLMAAPHIFVIGDSADTKYSGMAQTALHDANYVTKNLLRKAKGLSVEDYRPKRPIYAIPVGRRWAAVLWGRIRIVGPVGWMLRRLADLRLYLVFLPLRKALTTWKFGFTDDEACQCCKK